MQMEMGVDRVVKTASTAEERSRLRDEAEVLRRAAHPGVVRVVAFTEGRLELERVGGGSLASRGDEPLEVTAGWGAALATTLADLHDVGCTHGSIDAGHVLFDADGRPVLCGFGRAAGGTGSEWQERVRRDVSALATLIRERLPPGAPRKLARALSKAAGGGGVGARRLARLLVEEVPGARIGAGGGVTGGGAPQRVRARRVAPRRRVAFAAVAAAVAGVSALVAVVASRAGGQPPAAPQVLAPPGLAGRYSLTVEEGERARVVTGDWTCSAPAERYPAVLDAASGAVWVFVAWPAPGRPLRGRLVARVAGATGLSVRKGPGGCDHLVVRRGAGAAVVVPAMPGLGRGG